MVDTLDFPTTSNPVVGILGEEILKGIAAINEANVSLLAKAESETGVREIDKQLKTFVKSDDNDLSDKDPEIVKAVADLQKKQDAFKKAQEAARNLYRTKVLGEEEQAETSEVDADQVKQQRKLVMESIGVLKTFAEQNSLPEVVSWANTVEVPQVGRQGSSSVGQKKPRAYVTVNGVTHESFGEAAKALSTLLSTEDAKVTVTPGDLVSAWDEAGNDSFEYEGKPVSVAKKETKRAAA